MALAIGLILLFIVAVLIYFGLLHRVLDRMRLDDRQALIIIGLMVVASFIDLPLFKDRLQVSLNVGGALIPLIVAVYLLVTADERVEWVRALIATAVTAIVLVVVNNITDFNPPQEVFIDPIWLFGIVAGVSGYLAGRSRRSAFIAGTLGIVTLDVIHLIRAVVEGIPATVAIGGAGVFDATVLAGLIAVGLAEVVGEVRERLQGGPKQRPDTPLQLRNEEFEREVSKEDEADE
ncbi:MAG: DUF1614 domain-containing protein [Limnochordia bacterium]|jgi:uncharacterized membrane protein|nr:DUF1614 domain-containing protein [Limnochordia bacterium]